jgi:hypothetical protein
MDHLSQAGTITMQFISKRGFFIAAAALMALGLAACEQAKEGFDKGFNEKFEVSTHDSCVKSATASGAPASVAETYCSCFTAEIVKLPVEDKMKLTPADPRVSAAAETCRAKVQQ